MGEGEYIVQRQAEHDCPIFLPVGERTSAFLLSSRGDIVRHFNTLAIQACQPSKGGLWTTGKKGVDGHEREVREYQQAYLEGNKAGKEVEAAVKRYKSHRHTFTEEI